MTRVSKCSEKWAFVTKYAFDMYFDAVRTSTEPSVSKKSKDNSV